MSQPIIEVQGVSKKFIISHEAKERYLSLRDVIANRAKSLLSRNAGFQNTTTREEFYALRDISFSINKGDRVGIIGRNGAGKSTLLKILSRITEPSKGHISIRGRVASLLEVGTGFHPELSGRENIFLNGAILGMSRAEIRKKFDEIVDFAEISTFLDTPVKRYSSGMYVKLAFAVAAHLEPEILIIDEVLAVGDVQFQKKCLGKMEDVSKNDGRTILFVSHQMPTILNLCETCIFLDRGQVNEIGPSSDVVSNYMKQGGMIGTRYEPHGAGEVLRKASPYFTLSQFYIATEKGADCTILQASDNDKIVIYIEGEIEEMDDRFNIGFVLRNEFGENIIISYSTDQPESQWIRQRNGKVVIKTGIDATILTEGKYYIYLLASLHCVKMLLTSEDNICIGFEVIGNRGLSPYWTNKRNSVLAPFIPWNLIEP
ncbi:MAG TPA: polysaccharide ABC transporter ATP-binding protein [Puia sp.]|jgi:lipopolysaccharide transport system ATP-binding protein